MNYLLRFYLDLFRPKWPCYKFDPRRKFCSKHFNSLNFWNIDTCIEKPTWSKNQRNQCILDIISGGVELSYGCNSFDPKEYARGLSRNILFSAHSKRYFKEHNNTEIIEKLSQLNELDLYRHNKYNKESLLTTRRPIQMSSKNNESKIRDRCVKTGNMVKSAIQANYKYAFKEKPNSFLKITEESEKKRTKSKKDLLNFHNQKIKPREEDNENMKEYNSTLANKHGQQKLESVKQLELLKGRSEKEIRDKKASYRERIHQMELELVERTDKLATTNSSLRNLEQLLDLEMKKQNSLEHQCKSLMENNSILQRKYEQLEMERLRQFELFKYRFDKVVYEKASHAKRIHHLETQLMGKKEQLDTQKHNFKKLEHLLNLEKKKRNSLEDENKHLKEGMSILQRNYEKLEMERVNQLKVFKIELKKELNEKEAFYNGKIRQLEMKLAENDGKLDIKTCNSKRNLEDIDNNEQPSVVDEYRNDEKDCCSFKLKSNPSEIKHVKQSELYKIEQEKGENKKKTIFIEREFASWLCH